MPHHSGQATLGTDVTCVLIVEDQAEIRELIRMTLEFEDYALHEAENGERGLAEAQRVRPDLILLDVMMPGALDGLQLCRLLKQDPVLSRAKVVMLTARAQMADREAASQAGADAYLVKPFSPLELLHVVRRSL